MIGFGSQKKSEQGAAQRIAVNTRVQGTAADIIKVAMVSLQNAIQDKGLKSKLVIQVHDELVFDGFPGEEDILSTLIQEHMEGVGDFKVPLKVDMAISKNWMDA